MVRPNAIWAILKRAFASFLEDEALTRGAAIAFYTVTSIGPILLMVVGIAGLAFGREAAQNALTGQLSGLMGREAGEFLQSVLANAQSKTSGVISTLVGAVTLLVAATGVFGEMQSALNTIWKVETRAATVGSFVRARAASLGLVVTLGFLLMVSLVVSAGITAMGNFLDASLPLGKYVIWALNFLISTALIALLFGAIYKVLPDRRLEWRDVALGAIVTALLFSAGKFLIGWYLGASAAASAYGAAGALVLLLLWVYYSAQIFLFGAEFTKAFALQFGSRRNEVIAPKTVTT